MQLNISGKVILPTKSPVDPGAETLVFPEGTQFQMSGELQDANGVAVGNVSIIFNTREEAEVCEGVTV